MRTANLTRVRSVIAACAVALMASACTATTADDDAAEAETTAATEAAAGDDTAAEATDASGADGNPDEILVHIASVFFEDDGPRERAQLMVDDLLAGRPDGSTPMVVEFVSWEEFFDEDCLTLIPEGDARPDVLLTDHYVGTTLSCHSDAGIPVLTTAEQLVSETELAPFAGVFPMFSATVDDVTTVSTQYMADDAPGTGPVALYTSATFTDPEAWSGDIAAAAETMSAALGRDVIVYEAPAFDGSPSWDAEMATIPVRMKDDGIEAIIGLPGTDPIDLLFLTDQGLDVPYYTSPIEFLSLSLDYPADSITALAFNLLVSGTADQQRARMETNEAGQQCLAAIDRGGQDADEVVFPALATFCAAIQVVLTAEAAGAEFGTVDGLVAGLDAAGVIDTPDGLTVDLSGGRLSGRSSFAVLTGDSACECLVDTGERIALDG